MTPSGGNPYLVGFVGSIAAGLVVLVAAWLVRRHIVPRVKHAMHRGPDISGSWAWYDTTSTNPIGDVEIRQVGYLVSGTLTRHQSTTGDSSIRRVFEFEGKFLSRQFFVTFEEPAMRGTIAGVISMALSTQGRTLTGKSVYLEHDVREVTAHDFRFERRSA